MKRSTIAISTLISGKQIAKINEKPRKTKYLKVVKTATKRKTDADDNFVFEYIQSHWQYH